MVFLLADENFNNRIIRGLFLRKPDLDLVRAQDVGLSKTPDEAILAWAASNGRVFLTHDFETVPKHAYDRIRMSLPMAGVFVADTYISIGQAIDDILILVECSLENEWNGQVRYLPL